MCLKEGERCRMLSRIIDRLDPGSKDRVKQDRYPALCVLTRTVARAHFGARICKGG
jgi:hypothetical protein